MQFAHTDDERLRVLRNEIEEQLHGFMAYPPAALQVDTK